MKRRALVCFIMCMVLLFATVMRVAFISTTDYSKVNKTQNGIRLSLSDSRGTVYDCNMVRLTNSEEKILACVSPTPRAITAISQVLKGDKLKDVLEQLKGNKPVVCQVPEKINCDGIVCTTVYSDADTPTRHIIGYTDKDNKGVSGLEKAYDSILYTEESVSVFYSTDAKGRILEGVKPQINNNNIPLKNGVITTLDINIQSIAENYAQGLEKGCVVVSDIKGKIKALVSRPYFDSENVGIYLESENSPLINRALNRYNVGSVFKPCVAAAGIENGYKDFNHICTGSSEIIDRRFKCHEEKGHGLLDLRGALAFSCNTYFYNYAFNLGYEPIYKTAQKLSFNQALTLCDGISASRGNLPSKEKLSNIAHLANFSIGQGELLLSPIALLNLYSAIASDGTYYIPSLVEGTIENGNIKRVKSSLPTRAMEKNTAEILRQYLQSVIEEGTGEKARPETVTASGKTATAQTGKFRDGREICSAWFCGFFPSENPRYVVTVFSEDDQKQTLTCAEIFSKIADSVNSLK